MADKFWLAFLPMFVAVDPIGLLPLFVALTEGMAENARRRVVIQSVVTALAVALGFLVAGKFLLRVLGVTINDFLIAGGVLLFVVALGDILSAQKTRVSSVSAQETLGAVPLGVPLIVGPAVLTTSLVLLDSYGAVLTVAAVTLNVLLAGVVLWFSRNIVRMLGAAGARVVSKVACLVLAALAVTFVRRGILAVLAGQG